MAKGVKRQAAGKSSVWRFSFARKGYAMSRTVVDRRTGKAKNYGSSSLGHRGGLEHPKNCKCECPYGYGRAFCWPCMKKIVSEHNAAKKSAPKEV